MARPSKMRVALGGLALLLVAGGATLLACGSDSTGACDGCAAPDASTDTRSVPPSPGPNPSPSPTDDSGPPVPDGGLGSGFGEGGIATLPGTDDSETGNAIARQADGKLVVATWNQSSSELEVVRFDAEGALDATFGAGGKVVVWSGDPALARRVAVQADGKILAFASIRTEAFDLHSLLVRLDASGAYDQGFADHGRLFVVDLDGADMKVQADGTILVAGDHKTPADGGYGFELEAVRLTPAGEIDPTFASSGRLAVGFGTSPLDTNYTAGVAVSADDKIVLAGSYRPLGGKFAPVAARFDQTGTPDPTFGAGGKAMLAFGPDEYYATSDVLVQPDGKIVVGGSKNSSDVFLARFDSAGAADGTFGNGGVLTTTLPGIYAKTVIGLGFASSGRIVALAGEGTMGYLVRATSGGALDATFSGGSVTVPMSFSFGGLTVLPDDRILCTGSVSRPPQANDTAVVRRNADGTADVGFGTTGVAQANAGATFEAFTGVVAFPDGRLAALTTSEGPGYGGPRIVGFSAGGAQDSTVATASGVAVPRALAVDSQGRLVVAGTSGSVTGVYEVSRSTSAGVDSDFGESGLATLGISGSVIGVSSVTTDGQSRILVGGTVSVAAGPGQALIGRLTTLGQSDPQFGTSGAALLPIAGKNAGILAIAAQPDGKVIAVGSAGPGTQVEDDLLVVRLDATGVPDATFGGAAAGVLTADVRPEPFEYARAVAVDADGKIVVAAIATTVRPYDTVPDLGHYGGVSRAMVLRYLPTGDLDASFGTQGVVMLDVLGDDAMAHAVALEPDGKIVVAGRRYTPANGGTVVAQREDGVFVRLLPSGELDASFAAGGVFVIGAGDASAVVSFARQPDGKLVGAGLVHRSPSGADAALFQVVVP